MLEQQQQNWWFRCVLLMKTTTQKEWTENKSKSTGSQLLNRKRDIYFLSHFEYLPLGTLDTKRCVREGIDSIWKQSKNNHKERKKIKMEKCTIKLNHWIVIVSFRFHFQPLFTAFIILLIVAIVLYKRWRWTARFKWIIKKGWTFLNCFNLNLLKSKF